MSLDVSRTRFEHSKERELASGAAAVIDGMALISDFTGTYEKAALSTGAGGDKFLGVAIVQVVRTNNLPYVETITAPSLPAPPAPVSVTLSKSVLQPATLKCYKADGTLLVAGVPAAGNDVYSILGQVVTLGGLLAGLPITLWYLYSPSINEVLATFKQAAVNYDNQNTLLGQVSVGGGVGAEIFTDQWNSDQGRFTLGGEVKLGANGLFVAGGVGPVVGKVVKVPLTNDTYIGFRITDYTAL